MQIIIKTTAKAQVTIDGKNVPSVDAAILINPNELQTELDITLQTFEKGKPVVSNLSNEATTYPNDPDTDPDQLIVECNDTMVAYLINLGYGVGAVK